MENEKNEVRGFAKGGESIRAWYDRTTNKVRKAIVWASIIGLIFAVCFYVFAPQSVNLKLQIFNGAVTIPVAAGIWIAAFVWLFLLPSREAGFRSQEAMEETVRMLDKAIQEKIVPAIEVWQRIGLQVERDLPQFLKDAKESVETIRDIARKNDKLAEDARPALDALRRIEHRIEKELASGFVEDVRAAVDGLKDMTLPKNATTPDLDRALSAIGNRTKKG